jgi:hypothetical protein
MKPFEKDGASQNSYSHYTPVKGRRDFGHAVSFLQVYTKEHSLIFLVNIPKNKRLFWAICLIVTLGCILYNL